MNAPFFITGIPRSRTAWLANFLTWGNAFCHHDLLRLGCSVPALRRNLEATRAEIVGDSDSALLHFAPQLVREFPTARWLLVKRPSAECARDFVSYFKAHPYPGIPPLTEAEAAALFLKAAAQCEALRDIVPAGCLLEMSHTELDSVPGLQRVWEWLLPTLPFDTARAAMLNTFNVSIISEKLPVNLNS